MTKWILVLVAACVVPQNAPPQRATPSASSTGAPVLAATPAVAEMPKLPETDSGLFSKDCTVVQKAIAVWQMAEAGYDALESEAEAKHWDHKTYDQEVGAYVNAHLGYGGPGTTGGAAAETNMCTCTTTKIDEACASYAKQGLPSVLCDAAKAHEAKHREECQANQALPDSDPGKWHCNGDASNQAPAQLDHNEHLAYEATLAVLDAYYDKHCPNTCKTFAKARAWAGSIGVTYTRTNRTNYTDEQLIGSASYTSALAIPPLAPGVNGYTVTWMGPATGTARFEDVEHKLDGGKPFTGTGSGPLVKDPPLGRFNTEILRIDPDKCLYAFETSAAISSTWSDHTTTIDGTHVQLGTFEIPKRARTLGGTQTIPLPAPTLDWPGPAVWLPNQPIDWKARGHIGGYLTISWKFMPVQ